MSTPFNLTISATDMHNAMVNGQTVCLLDCTFDLANPDSARQAFASLHITGAQHADLDQHLSAHGEVPAINGGRHPLPTREWFAQQLAAWGITPQTQVVVYDRNGQNFCGRAWWMLKWCGHDAVAVLDGGLAAWQAIGGATSSNASNPSSPVTSGHTYPLGQPLVKLVDIAHVLHNWHHAPHPQVLVDARATTRFNGDTEPLDPVAGHIPGAINHPFASNFDEQGLFKSAEALRALWHHSLGERDAHAVVMQCGSGVSAVPNIIAMALAGLPMPALYAGSWSEWCRTPGTPRQGPTT